MQHAVSQEVSKELLTWFASVPFETRLEVMRRLNPKPFRKTKTPEEARLYALLAATDEVRKTLALTERKNTGHDLSSLDDAHELRLETITALRRKKAPLRRKLELHAGTLQKLADEGCSLRQMAAYARKHLRFSVSPAYLRQFCIEFGITFRRKV